MTHIQWERRNDLHREHLIEVGLGLKKAHGAELARDYLEEVAVPEKIILRILSGGGTRDTGPDDEPDDMGLAWLKPRGPALMTGSGACVFAAFDTEARARAVLAELPADMRGFVARGLDRHPLRHLLD